MIDVRSLREMRSEMGVWHLVRQAASSSGFALATSGGCQGCKRQTMQGPAGRPGLVGGVGSTSPGGPSSDDEGDDSSTTLQVSFGLVNCSQVFLNGSLSEENGEAVAADGDASGGTDSDSKAKEELGITVATVLRRSQCTSFCTVSSGQFRQATRERPLCKIKQPNMS